MYLFNFIFYFGIYPCDRPVGNALRPAYCFKLFAPNAMLDKNFPLLSGQNAENILQPQTILVDGCSCGLGKIIKRPSTIVLSYKIQRLMFGYALQQADVILYGIGIGGIIHQLQNNIRGHVVGVVGIFSDAESREANDMEVFIIYAPERGHVVMP